MAKYLWMGKYSPQGAAGVTKEGLTSRKQAIDQLMTGLGMKCLNVWGLAEGDWDFMILSEGDSQKMAATQAAVSLMSHGTGAFERAQIYTLLETEEVDEAQKAMPGYRPPGG